MSVNTLVLSSAGLWGAMYVGVYNALYERGMMAGIRNIYGSSAGALAGMIMSMDLTPDVVKDVTYHMLSVLGMPIAGWVDVLYVWKKLGAIDSSTRRDMIRYALQAGFPGVDDVDFTTFAKHTGRNLVVMGSNITTTRAERFSVDTTPHMSVLEAVNISTCIPVLFQPMAFKGCMYLDGGMYSWLPAQQAKQDGRNDAETLAFGCPPYDDTVRMYNLRDLVMTLSLGLVNKSYEEDSKLYTHSTELITKACEMVGTIKEVIGWRRNRQRLPTSVIDKMIFDGYTQASAALRERESIVQNTLVASRRCQPANQCIGGTRAVVNDDAAVGSLESNLRNAASQLELGDRCGVQPLDIDDCERDVESTVATVIA